MAINYSKLRVNIFLTLDLTPPYSTLAPTPLFATKKRAKAEHFSTRNGENIATKTRPFLDEMPPSLLGDLRAKTFKNRAHRGTKNDHFLQNFSIILHFSISRTIFTLANNIY